jgi:hypothetical protein
MLQHVALEGVDQLVSEHVIRFAERRRERQDDAPALMIGEAAHALGNVPGEDGRLREMRMAGIQHDRRTFGEGVREHVRQTSIPALRKSGRHLRRLGLVRVVIDVEMRRGQHLKVEAVVLDLVGSEVLCRQGRRQYATEGECQRHRADDTSRHDKSCSGKGSRGG